MKKTAMLIALLCGVTLLLCGCLTPSQKARLDEFPDEAIAYYQEKYGESITITEHGYCNEPTLFLSPTDNIYAKCSDGTVIIYDSARDTIADNKQSAEIGVAIETALQADLDALADQIGDARFIIDYYSASYYSVGFEGDFFHAYYNGDIEDFIKAEDIPLCAEINLICQREDAWKDAENGISQLLKTRYRTDRDVTLNAINDKCARYESNYGISKEGCFAVLEFSSDGVDRRIQKFVKVADGVYVTANAKNFVFEDGDITLVETDMTPEDLNQLMLGHYRALPETSDSKKNPSQENQEYGTIFTNTAIYRLEFSDRVKAQFPDGVDAFLRFEPYELDIQQEDEILYFANGTEPFYCCTKLSDRLEYTTNAYHITENDRFLIGFQFLCSGASEDS